MQINFLLGTVHGIGTNEKGALVFGYVYSSVFCCSELNSTLFHSDHQKHFNETRWKQRNEKET